MATNNLRFTVSISPDMEADLDWLKKERYYKNTRSEMVRDLIRKGLECYRAELEAEPKDSEV